MQRPEKEKGGEKKQEIRAVTIISVMLFTVRRADRGRPSLPVRMYASRAINILHRVFIMRERLREIAEISRFMIYRRRFITAERARTVAHYRRYVIHETELLFITEASRRRKFTTLRRAAPF